VSKTAHANADDPRRALCFGGGGSTGQDVGVQNMEAIQEDLEGVQDIDHPRLQDSGPNVSNSNSPFNFEM